MNSISWFLYAVNVLDNIQGLVAAILIFTLIAWAVLNVAVPVSEGEVLSWPDYKKWWVRGLATLVIGGFLLAFIPSKNTMYAIAAAQIGERMAQSDAVQGIASDATKALHAWIKKQIEPEQKK